MHSESHVIREKLVGPTQAGIGELVDGACASVLGKFDDPLFATDPTVAQFKPEAVRITTTLAEALKALQALDAKMSSGLDDAKEAKAKKPQQAAKDASDKGKVAEAASKAAAAPRPTALARAAGSTAAPANAAGARGRQTYLQKAMAKPIGDRSGEELLATAKAEQEEEAARGTKCRKTQDISEQLELANVGDTKEKAQQVGA